MYNKKGYTFINAKLVLSLITRFQEKESENYGT
jgi:hypothetical protein